MIKIEEEITSATNESHQNCLLAQGSSIASLCKGKRDNRSNGFSSSTPTWFHSRMSFDIPHKSLLYCAKGERLTFFRPLKCDFAAGYPSICHLARRQSMFIKPEKEKLLTNLTWTNQIQALFSSWPMKILNCDKQVSITDKNNSHVDQMSCGRCFRVLLGELWSEEKLWRWCVKEKVLY